MRQVWVTTVVCIFLLLPGFMFAAVVINEVLFDPSGTDTGLEKIEVYNPDAAAADMGGWELNPDDIGYFSFPSGFSLAAQSFVVVHLRAPGTNDAANLYHPTPSTKSANMGNSSGSVALFRPGGRTKDTIADFVRYQKPGSAEKKTWESTAVEAGLWTAGAFVDTASVTEGQPVGLAADGVRGSAASWQVFSSPSLGSANVPSAVAPSPAPLPATAAPPPPPPAAGGGAPVPSLGADAGPDVRAVSGAAVMFSAMAFGLDGAPMPDARFLWNFGDGSLGQGRVGRHVYQFPGVYAVNLSVQSGHYAGADWLTATIAPPELSVSEARPGPDGFVEIANASAEAIDLGGLALDDGRVRFIVPAGTRIAAEGVLAFANATTGLDPVAAVTLRDARPVMLDAAEFPGILPAGASWEKSGSEFAVQRWPTPGRRSAVPLAGAPSAAAPPKVLLTPPPASAPVSARPVGAPALASASAPPPALAAAGSAVGPGVLFAASIVLGAAMAAVIVALKRVTPRSGSSV